MKPEDKAVIEQALEALGDITNFERLEKARAALRQLLEQPEQEPVAVVDANDEGYWADILPDRSVKVGQVLYAAAQPAVQDKRLKVKLGSQYGKDLSGHWFYLQPADEFAEAALHKHTGVAAAQPAHVQEPDAVVTGYHGGQCIVTPTDPARVFNTGTAFYTQPTDHSEQHLDMVDHGDELTIAYLDGVHTGKKIAKREWVGLTPEQIRACFFAGEPPASSPPHWWEYRNPDYMAIYSNIDAKLREKNGGAT